MNVQISTCAHEINENQKKREIVDKTYAYLINLVYLERYVCAANIASIDRASLGEQNRRKARFFSGEKFRFSFYPRIVETRSHLCKLQRKSTKASRSAAALAKVSVKEMQQHLLRITLRYAWLRDGILRHISCCSSSRNHVIGSFTWSSRAFPHVYKHIT